MLRLYFQFFPDANMPTVTDQMLQRPVPAAKKILKHRKIPGNPTGSQRIYTEKESAEKISIPPVQIGNSKYSPSGTGTAAKICGNHLPRFSGKINLSTVTGFRLENV